jgi:hypothetical protein
MNSAIIGFEFLARIKHYQSCSWGFMPLSHIDLRETEALIAGMPFVKLQEQMPDSF